MYVCMYVCMYVYTHVYLCRNVYIHTCVYIYIYIYILPIYIYVNIDEYSYVYLMHILVRAHIHANTHVYIYMYIHVHTHFVQIHQCTYHQTRNNIHQQLAIQPFFRCCGGSIWQRGPEGKSHPSASQLHGF